MPTEIDISPHSVGAPIPGTQYAIRTTQYELLLAVIYQAGDFAAKIFAMDYHVNKAML